MLFLYSRNVLLCVLVLFSVTSIAAEDIGSVIDDILSRLEEKEARISMLEATVGLQQATLQQQHTTIGEQQQRITTLEHNLANRPEVLESHPKEKTVGQAESSVVIKETKIELEKTNKSKADDDHDTPVPSQRHRKRRQLNETPIAFLATLYEHAGHLGDNQNIAFDHVITDFGNSYNPHGGIFIASVSGIYVFSTTLFSLPNVDGHFAFKRNGATLTTLYIQPSTSGYATTSFTLVLQLAQGDDVSVANVDQDKGVHGYHHSNFTGFLLQELYEDNGEVVGK